MVRKREPGGGRKPSPHTPRAQLTVRMPDDLRKQLERSVARRKNGHGWTLTDELVHRLQRSFNRERDERRDPAARALCYLLAEVISFVNAERNDPTELVIRDGNAEFVPNSGWRSDPFYFRAIRLAFDLILNALQPPGEMRPPRTAEQPLDGEVRILGERFPIPAHTPEDLARSVRDLILFQLAREPHEFASQERPLAMSQAARALQLKQGTKP